MVRLGFHCLHHGGKWAGWSPSPSGRLGTVAERKDNERCAGAPLCLTHYRRTTLLSGAPGTHRFWGRAVQPPWSYDCHARQHIQRVYTSAAKSSRCAPAGRVFRHLCVRYLGRWHRYRPIPRPSTPPPSSWHHQTGPPCTGPGPLNQSAEGEEGRIGAPHHSGHPGAPPGEPVLGGPYQGPKTDDMKLEGKKQRRKKEKSLTGIEIFTAPNKTTMIFCKRDWWVCCLLVREFPKVLSRTFRLENIKFTWLTSSH